MLNQGITIIAKFVLKSPAYPAIRKLFYGLLKSILNFYMSISSGFTRIYLSWDIYMHILPINSWQSARDVERGVKNGRQCVGKIGVI